jgi:hypothetical protein
MPEILHTETRGAWKAHVVRLWSIRLWSKRLSGKLDLAVQLDHPNGLNTSWPIQYANGDIGYVFDSMPRDAKRATRAAFRWMDE